MHNNRHDEVMDSLGRAHHKLDRLGYHVSQLYLLMGGRPRQAPARPQAAAPSTSTSPASPILQRFGRAALTFVIDHLAPYILPSLIGLAAAVWAVTKGLIADMISACEMLLRWLGG